MAKSGKKYKAAALLISAVLAVTLLAPGVGLAAEESFVRSFTLEEAEDYALKNNDGLKDCDQNIDKLQNTYDQTEYSLKRKFRVSDIDKIADSKVFKNMDKAPSTEVGRYDTDRKILIAPKELRTQLNNLKDGRAQVEEGIKIAVDKDYYAILEDRQNLDVLKKSLELAKKGESIAQVQFDNGMITKEELLQSKIGVTGVKTQINQTQNSLNKDMLSLKKQMGLPADALFKLETSLIVPDVSDIDVEKGVDSALEKRMEIIEDKRAIDINEQDFDLIKSYYTDFNFQYKDGQLKLDNSQAKLRSDKHAVEQDVRQNYINLMNASSALSVLQQNIDAEKESLRVAQLKLKYGVGTVVDVLNAQQSIMECRLELVKAQHMLGLAKINYDVSTDIGLPGVSQTGGMGDAAQVAVQ